MKKHNTTFCGVGGCFITNRPLETSLCVLMLFPESNGLNSWRGFYCIQKCTFSSIQRKNSNLCGFVVYSSQMTWNSLLHGFVALLLVLN